jgi:hypothetical protein
MFDGNHAPILHRVSTVSEKDQNKLPLEPRDLVVPSSVSKRIYEPMVRLVQTMNLSCTDTNTVSHRKQKRDSTWPTSPRGSIGCIQKWFPSLWFVRHKLCTYLASRLAISPNRPSFHWRLVSKEYIGCIQNDLWADATFGANCASICTDTNTISKRNEVRFEMTHVT